MQQFCRDAVSECRAFTQTSSNEGKSYTDSCWEQLQIDIKSAIDATNHHATEECQAAKRYAQDVNDERWQSAMKSVEDAKSYAATMQREHHTSNEDVRRQNLEQLTKIKNYAEHEIADVRAMAHAGLMEQTLHTSSGVDALEKRLDELRDELETNKQALDELQSKSSIVHNAEMKAMENMDDHSAQLFNHLRSELAQLSGKLKTLEQKEQEQEHRLTKVKKDVDASVSDLQRTVGGSLQRLTEKYLSATLGDEAQARQVLDQARARVQSGDAMHVSTRLQQLTAELPSPASASSAKRETTEDAVSQNHRLIRAAEEKKAPLTNYERLLLENRSWTEFKGS